jgi:hypothetical protein
MELTALTAPVMSVMDLPASGSCNSFSEALSPLSLRAALHIPDMVFFEASFCLSSGIRVSDFLDCKMAQTKNLLSYDVCDVFTDLSRRGVIQFDEALSGTSEAHAAYMDVMRGLVENDALTLTEKHKIFHDAQNYKKQIKKDYGIDLGDEAIKELALSLQQQGKKVVIFSEDKGVLNWAMAHDVTPLTQSTFFSTLHKRGVLRQIGFMDDLEHVWEAIEGFGFLNDTDFYRLKSPYFNSERRISQFSNLLGGAFPSARPAFDSEKPIPERGLPQPIACHPANTAT